MKITGEELIDIIAEVSHRMHSNIKYAYRQGNLENYLTSIGMEDILAKTEKSFYDSEPDGKILIFGDSQIKEKDIFGCLKGLGISKDRVELHLGYEKAKRYQYTKLQYNPQYRLIIFGPIPHSVEGMMGYSSIISMLEDSHGYPRVVKLKDGHALKLTKTSLKTAIKESIDSGYLAV